MNTGEVEQTSGKRGKTAKNIGGLVKYAPHITIEGLEVV
jgi:hypothetical protein